MVGEPVHAEAPEREPQPRAQHHQHHALREQLPHEATTPRAQDRAQGDLPLTLLRPCEQQVRDVGTRDQQDEEDRPLQQRVEDLRAAVRDVRARVEDVHRPVAHGLRVLERERARDVGDVLPCLLHRHTRCEPRDREEIATIARALGGGIGQGHPDVRRREEEGERLGQDADDLDRLPAQGQHSPDGILVALRPLPELRGHDRDATGPGHALLRQERAAPLRGHADDLEEVGFDLGGADRLRSLPLPQAENRRAKGRPSGRRPAPFRHVGVRRQRRGQCGEPRRLLAAPLLEHDQPLGLERADRLEKQAVDEREHRRVSGDRHREGRHRDECHPPAARQYPQRETNILPQCRHPVLPGVPLHLRSDGRCPAGEEGPRDTGWTVTPGG